MASAADIPAELFEDILFYVCGGSSAFWDLSPGLPVWKEAIKTLTACSLTCVYWARICRRTIFSRLRFHNYKDICAFLSLVENTPETFTPASEYVWLAVMVQRVEDRPWLHLLQLRPSLVQNMLHAFVDFTFIDSATPNEDNQARRPVHLRLFSGLPRSLPSSCHRCDSFTVCNPRFRDASDLISLLNKFSARRPRSYGLQLTLDKVSWDDTTLLGFQNGLTISEPLATPFRYAHVVVTNSTNSAETAWLAYSSQATLPHQVPFGTSTTSMGNDVLPLQLQPTAQRVALEIGKIVCQARGTVARFALLLTAEDQYSYNNLELVRICHFNAKHEEEGCAVNFDFYALQPPTEQSTEDSNIIVIDHISVVSVFVEFPSGRPLSEDGSFVGAQNVIEYRWQDIVDLCASIEGFMSLQLSFPSRGDLVQFTEARAAALARLSGRVALFHETEDGIPRAVDLTTLQDKGGTFLHTSCKLVKCAVAHDYLDISRVSDVDALQNGHVAWWY